MIYSVVISRRAQKEHVSIPSPSYDLIERHLILLGENPRPPGCKKLKGREGGWRVRAGTYRIIYEIDDTRALVTFLPSAIAKTSIDNPFKFPSFLLP